MHRLTEFSLRYPWFTAAVLFAVTAGLAAGIPNIQPGYGYRVLLGDHHPAVQNLDSMIEEYAGGSPIRIAWECGENHPCRTAFDESSLQMAARVSRQLELLPAVRAVQGPADTALLVPVPDGFAVRHFLEDGQVPADAEDLARRALEDRFWRNTLVSADGSVGVILVQTTDNRPQTMVEVVDSIESILAIPRTNGFIFFMVGDAPGSVLGGRSLAESTDRLIPFLVGLTGIVIFIFVRSWQQTLASMLSTGLALLWALGILGWLGWPQDGMLEVLAPLILVLGICDSMHLLFRYSAERGNLKSEAATALRKATKDVAPACLVTTLTTAAAFISFTTSSLDTFARFGVIAACGVLACLFLSFSLVPIVLQWLPDDIQRTGGLSNRWQAVMDAVTRTAIKRPNSILISCALLLLLSAVGWSQLRVDQHWIEAYGERNQFVRSSHFMENRMGLSQTLEVEITLPADDELEQQSTLHLVDKFSRRVIETPELTKATSVLDLIERMNRLLHNDDPTYERIGETPAANAEILEILGFDDPETLGRWISLDRSQLRISLDSLDLAHREREQILNQVRTIAETTFPPDWGVSLSGEFAITHDWVRDVQATQLRSFPTAFAIVFVLVSIFLRSWKLGLAAMVPTLLPVVVILGLMGWAGLTLDVARAMIAAVVIGIGVDDAVHILAHYDRQRSDGLDPRPAMQAALRHTGRAVVTTSVALSLGFLTLMMSAWQTIASFGFLVSIAILGALAASLFVLPALIFAFAPAGEATRQRANPRLPVHSPGEAR